MLSPETFKEKIKKLKTLKLLPSTPFSFCMLRRLNQPRVKFWLKSDSNYLSIGIFNPNLSSKSKSLGRNHSNWIRFQSSYFKSIKNWSHLIAKVQNQKILIKNGWKRSTFWFIKTIFGYLIDILVKNWLTSIKNCLILNRTDLEVKIWMA